MSNVEMVIAMLGKKHSEATKKKMSDSQKGTLHLCCVVLMSYVEMVIGKKKALKGG